VGNGEKIEVSTPQDRVDFKGPGGWSASIMGNKPLYITMILVICSLILGLLWIHSRDADNRHKEVMDGNKDVIRELGVQSYIMTLADEEKKALRLREPEELSRRRR